MTVGKKTQQRWLSQRALAFSKHTAPYRALIEKLQQDTESKAKRAIQEEDQAMTIEQHLDDAAAAAPEPPVPPEPSAPVITEGR